MWSKYKLLIVQIFVLCLTYLAQAEKVMRPKIKDIKLWSDEKYVSHKITYDASDPHLNFTLDVLHEAHDIDMRLEMHVVNKLDPFYATTMNSTVNFCRIINWTTKSPVGGFVHGFLKEYGKTIDSCPVAKGHYRMHIPLKRKFQGQYFLHKIWWPEDSAVAMLPESDFEINFSLYHLDASKKRILVVNDHISGEMVVQDVNNFKPGLFAMLPKMG